MISADMSMASGASYGADKSLETPEPRFEKGRSQRSKMPNTQH